MSSTDMSGVRHRTCPNGTVPGRERSWGLPVDRGHVRVALARGRAFRERGLEPRQLLRRQLDVDGARVVLEVAPPLRPRDRDDVVAAGEHPRERKLGRRAPLLPRDLLDARHEVEVPPEVLALETRVVAPEVVL